MWPGVVACAFGATLPGARLRLRRYARETATTRGAALLPPRFRGTLAANLPVVGSSAMRFISVWPVPHAQDQPRVVEVSDSRYARELVAAESDDTRALFAGQRGFAPELLL